MYKDKGRREKEGARVLEKTVTKVQCCVPPAEISSC